MPVIDLLTPHAYLGFTELEVIKDSSSRSARRNSSKPTENFFSEESNLLMDMVSVGLD